MFKLLSSAVRSAASRVQRQQQVPSAIAALYSTFHPREFQFESSDGETGTLIHRFSRHIALTRRDFDDRTRFGFKYASFYPVYSPDAFLGELRKVSCLDLGKLICLTADFRSKTDFRLFADVANALDEESEGRVEGASFNELVTILHGFMYLLPNKITKLKSYRKAMPRLVELFAEKPNEKDFMTVLFFLGLWKRNAFGGHLMDQYLQSYLGEFLNDQLDLMDFAILANASYKTSVRISNERFLKRLENEICNFEGKDMALFVTLIKCARMNRMRSERVLEKLRSILENDATALDFRGLSHLFVYLAEISVKDDSLNKLFLDEASRRIEEEIATNEEEESTSQSFRPKDLATFLHGCATLSIPITQLDLEPNNLLNKIFEKIEREEYRYTPDTLVDTCLSLWVMNLPSVDLMSSIFSDRQMMQNFKRDRVKIESRRDLLLACAEIERPEAFKIISRLPRVDAFQLDRSCPEFLVRHRAQLQRVASCLEAAREKLQIAHVQFSLPVKFLNIAGLFVTLDNGVEFNVDVLEKTNCLSDEQTPTGLMGLKLRLLEHISTPNVVINSFAEQSDEQIVSKVEEAIQGLQPTKGKRKSRKSG
ncbi:uncharacterized protein LOC120423109 [Culex pipiens pallens]|uniref:uncharacterized protein LOC120423109 n=1 Tax=Culex pipiens pallens TaxID=42434 RepID=UPI001952C829|nr:uncharacterized protein LOC120423109 [Culex pipiens pallens]